MSSQLLAVSPIDGRYCKSAEKLSPYLSEFALIKYRFTVMIEYLRFLSKHPQIPLRALTEIEERSLTWFYEDFKLEDAAIIKAIETEGYEKHRRTNHDVKACELFLRDRLESSGMRDLVEWVHFARTSEDVNNIAYAIMLTKCLDDVIEPAIHVISDKLEDFATQYASLPMLSRTHGQAATPTTLGKEFAVFRERLARQIDQLGMYVMLIKLNSASGNYCADHAALPDVDWIDFTQQFNSELCQRLLVAFEVNLVTTQIEPHDTYAELFAILMRINTILIGFCQDIWRYVSDDWIVQKPVEGEAGSSIMPHKVNPIDFENAEGNLGIANALMEHFSRKLPISRLQRDLSDSTVERCFGMAFGHCLIAYTALARGMGKISANEPKIREALANHPEVLTEAYQTILRSVNYPQAYDALKSLSRGKTITLSDLHNFVHGLDDAKVDAATKEKMLALRPETYIGLAAKLATLDTAK